MAERGQHDHIARLLFSLLVQGGYHRLLWECPNFILEDRLIYLCFLTVALGRSGVGVCHYLIATTSPYVKKVLGTSLLAVQWLGLSTSTAGGTGLIRGWGTKIPASPMAWPKNKQRVQ